MDLFGSILDRPGIWCRDLHGELEEHGWRSE
jgi:hypothetical protein